MEPFHSHTQQKVVIASTFVAEPIAPLLTHINNLIGLKQDILFAPYAQVFQQLLTPQSQLRQNKAGVNILLLALEDWIQPVYDAKQEGPSHYRYQGLIDPDEASQKLIQISEELHTAVQEAVSASAVPYLICFCPASETAAAQPELHQQLMDAEARLTEALRPLANVHILEQSSVQQLYPIVNYYDAHADKMGHIPYTQSYFAALALHLGRYLYTLQQQPYKVIVLDCDNTLWEGVCGEDGADGIKLPEPFLALQSFMIGQSQAGMLLCLCSKNVEQDVWAVFDSRPEMRLKRDHLVSWRINWQPKSANLKALAAELNLGLNSFIFIDDNPVECAEVRANCPEVLTLHLPPEPAEVPRFLEHVWSFDHLKVTAEDQKRTQMYQQNLERERLRQETNSLDSFLASLNLEIEVAPLTTKHVARVAQLTQRTNQFNTTTKRRTEGDVQAFLQPDAPLQCLTVHVRDRFGDYGLVGVVMFTHDATAVQVDTFLLSCRVLGRGVEQTMLKAVGAFAAQHQLTTVHVPFIPTAKNLPALRFLEAIGSAYQQQTSAGLNFPFPTAFLETLNQHQTVPEVEEAVKQNTAATSDSTPALPQGIDFIARALYSPQKLIAYHNQQKRPRPAVQQTYVVPRTPTERAIATAWSDVLNIKKIGVDDNFQELGGSSIQLVQIHSKLQTWLHIPDLAITTLFQYPTITALAAYLAQTEGASGENQTHHSLWFKALQQRAERQRIALAQQAMRREEVYGRK